MLKPGALLRVGGPDVAPLIRQYVSRGPALLDERAADRLLAVQELSYWHRHVRMYDEETLVLVLSAAGFDQPRRRAPADTGLPTAPDPEHRKARTLCVEAARLQLAGACVAGRLARSGHGRPGPAPACWWHPCSGSSG